MVEDTGDEARIVNEFGSDVVVSKVEVDSALESGRGAVNAKVLNEVVGIGGDSEIVLLEAVAIAMGDKKAAENTNVVVGVTAMEDGT